ncbi:hypothetical protein [Streptomyces sp. NPDC047108]|uniref:hypothetical protein n=1 Tax=Streptomyces sp. NPDC047108 TaxID=3155025 RepID=UPI0033C3D288
MRATRRVPALLGAATPPVSLARVPGQAGAVLFVSCGEGALVDVVEAAVATDTAGGGGIHELSASVNLVGTVVRSDAPNNYAPPGSVPFGSG